MLIRFGYDLTVTCPQPTPMISMMGVEKGRAADIRVQQTRISSPDIGMSTYSDIFGNPCTRFTAPEGDLRLWGDCTVQDNGEPDQYDHSARQVPIAELPEDCLVYLMGSRYCDTDRLSQTAWDLFGQTPPGWPLVQAICDFTHRHIVFDYQNASSTRTASDAYDGKTGVCRDFTHLAITLCRAMNIPARYVNGYLGDIGVISASPDDFCAWMEVYIGDRWVTFDPRNNVPRIGRIVAARGRDAADVPLINSFGPHELRSFRVWTYEVRDVPDETLGAGMVT